MRIYTNSPLVGNRPASQGHANFAREAALDAFGPKAVHHLSGPDFVDREPDSASADEVVDGHQAVTHWLTLAVNLEGEEAEIAHQTADELRQVLGLSWADVLGRNAA